MALRKRLVAAAAIWDANKNCFVPDVAAILERLLLHDTYILKSHLLSEVPALANVLGIKNTIALLESRALRLHCEPVTFGQTGQATVLDSRRRKGGLPLGCFCFDAFRSASPDEDFSLSLKEMEGQLGATAKEGKNIRHLLGSLLQETPDNVLSDMTNGLESDLRGNLSLCKDAIIWTVKHKHGIGIAPSQLDLAVTCLDDTDYKIEHNLSKYLPEANPKMLHQLIEKAFLSLGGLNQRLAEMKGYDAMSGCRADELPLLLGKMEFLNSYLDPTESEKKWHRVVEIAGVPSFNSLSQKGGFDVKAFLRLRESAECAEFRDWLSNADSRNIEETVRRCNSFRAHVGTFLGTTEGQRLRFLGTSAAGLLPIVGPVLGVAAGFFDSFFVEKIFLKNGIAAFLWTKYLPLFHTDKDRAGRATAEVPHVKDLT